MDGQAWPGILAEPVREYEKHIDRGVRFHQLVERHQLGMETSRLAASVVDDSMLAAWWQAYLGFDMLHQLVGHRYPEFTLSVDVAGVRLSAVYDLLVVVPGERIVIFDWKTSLKKPPRQWFEARMQTKVYQYVLVTGGEKLFGGSLRPEQVMMVYWVVGAAAEPVIFTYDRRQYVLDGAYLEGIVREIGQLLVGVEWALTADEGCCRFCEYRSLCGRKVSVGSMEDFGNLADNTALSGVGFLLDDVLGIGF
jgi:hypothetical protein